MKTNLLSLSLILVIIAVILMDFNAPQLSNNFISYGMISVATLLFTGLYIYNLKQIEEQA